MVFVWMPPHMPRVRIVSVTYHLASPSVLIMGWYFCLFCWAVGVGLQSWQNENPMIWRLEFWVEKCVVFVLYIYIGEAVVIIRMSSLSLARHDLVVQRHGHSHVGIVFFGGAS